MKKILLSLFTVLMSVASFAQTTLDFSDASAWGYDNPVSTAADPYTQVNNGDVLKQGNIQISVAFASGNGVRFYNSTSNVINLRAYTPSTLTISTVDGSNMTAIEISGKNLGSTYIKDFDGYKSGAWSGSASSVTFEVIKSTVNINSIKIYSGSDAPADISNTPETAYTVSKAIELIDAGEGLSTEVYVKGSVTVVDSVSTSYGNATYKISDGTKTMTVYRGFGLKNAKFTSADDIQDGDDVVVYGKIKLYKDTYEVDANNYLYSLNGKTEADTPSGGDDEPTTPDVPENIVNTPETAYTPAQAAAFALAGKTDKVYVKGIITFIKSLNVEKYKNAQYTIRETAESADSFYVYNGRYLEDKDFTSNDAIKVGDEVIVYGALTVYKETPEFAAGNYIYSLNGKTKADEEPSVDPTDPDPETPETPYTVVGAGTLENPYTVEDVTKGIYKEGETTTGVWVKGTILGCFNSAATPIDESKAAVASNIALGNADGTVIIPVALVATKDNVSVPRQDLNLVDNPDMKGKEVWVYGDITTYFKTAGVKNTSDYSLDGKTTSSINGVTISSAPKAIYSVAGQKLNTLQKGVNIVDGKKVYNK